MFMYEVASAADTLALWKMVNDSVWASLQQLQKEEDELRAAAQRAVASKRIKRPTAVAGAKPKFSPPTPVTRSPVSTSAPMPQQMARVAAVPPASQNTAQPVMQPNKLSAKLS